MTSRPLYAWDSSIFLAWLSEEQDKPLGGIDSVVQEIDGGTASLLVSVVAYSEILRARHTAEQIEIFEKFLERTNVIVADNDIRIARKAEHVRSRALPRRKIKTADATHLATAIIYRADIFHTTDDKLIKLNASPLVDGLRISLPVSLSGQGFLDFT
jgi:predicted nucleic acid-binding protein